MNMWFSIKLQMMKIIIFLANNVQIRSPNACIAKFKILL